MKVSRTMYLSLFSPQLVQFGWCWFWHTTRVVRSFYAVEFDGLMTSLLKLLLCVLIGQEINNTNITWPWSCLRYSSLGAILQAQRCGSSSIASEECAEKSVVSPII